MAPRAAAKRIVVFGVTGQLGQELVERIDGSDWPVAELVGVASSESFGATFEFRDETCDVAGEWPALRGADLVFLCTRDAPALEIVRECLRAEVPCLDLTGALVEQAVGREASVPMPIGLLARVRGEVDRTSERAQETLANAPLVALPSATTLAWARVLHALGGADAIRRVVGTVLTSAGARGRRGLAALSEESIALFNQTSAPEVGPAGQPVAFDVVPGDAIDAARVRAELARVFASEAGADDSPEEPGPLRIDVASVEVPTFVGEGTSLVVELARPLERVEVEKRLEEQEGLTIVAQGAGSRGLAAIEPGVSEPVGPTLRDTAGVESVLVGSIEPDASRAPGLGWRLWLASDPLGLSAEHAIRVAADRLGLA